jgi:integrase
MSIKHQLQQSIYQILKHNRDGSKETQAARKHILYQMAQALVAGTYKLKHISGLKQKHVVYLNEQWKNRELSIATIKNRNAHLRWLCEKLHKPTLIPSNEKLGIGKRHYVNNQLNKAINLTQVDLTKITNPHILVHIHLQYYFGLRREESIKLKPHQADKGDYIELQPSWCKGGRGRHVPILSDEARYWLNEAKKLAIHPTDSLIPKDKSYIQHRRVYDKQIQRAGIKHAHGLRHAFAQVFKQDKRTN